MSCPLYIDTGDYRLRALLNEVFAYVATSRPEYDMQLFADEAGGLYRVLSRENETHKALSPEQIGAYREQLVELSNVVEVSKPVEREDMGLAV